MSLLIHFAETDLGEITIEDTPDPLWETLLALHALQAAEVDPVVQHWRTTVSVTTPIRDLFDIAPARGYSPDFLTPDQSTAGLEAGLAGILGAPAARLRADLERLTRERDVPAWAKALATGDQDQLRDLVDGLRAFHRTALAPHWASMVDSVLDDRRARARVLLDTGVTGLLSTLHPLLTWQGMTLTLHSRYVNRELRLDGRGLRLVPSFFCHAAPTVLADPGLPPVLVYPIAIDAGRFHLRPRRSAGPTAPLAALLGKTRAALLTAAAIGRTTTELGNHAGITPASASYHASILRDAGLIVTHRQGAAVCHRLTELGAELVTRQHS